MTHQEGYTVTSDLAEKGSEAVPELMRILINNVMRGASSLRLISALLMQISEEWQIGKHYCAGKLLNY